MSFHPLAFSSTAKGVEGGDPGEGGEKSKEAAARAVDAGAKKPDAISAAELSGKIRAHDDSPSGEIPKNQPVNPTADEYETILKLFREHIKENEENVLKGVERLLEVHSHMEEERSRIGLNNQTMWILLGVFIEIAVVGAATFIFLV